MQLFRFIVFKGTHVGHIISVTSNIKCTPKYYYRLPGSGPSGLLEAQILWFGQPWQALLFPACSLPVPGQSVSLRKRSKVRQQNSPKELVKVQKHMLTFGCIFRNVRYVRHFEILYEPAICKTLSAWPPRERANMAEEEGSGNFFFLDVLRSI